MDGECIAPARDVSRRFYPPKRSVFLHVCATCFELPSNLTTMKIPETSNSTLVTYLKYLYFNPAESAYRKYHQFFHQLSGQLSPVS